MPLTPHNHNNNHNNHQEKDWPEMDENEIFEVAKQMTLIESSFIQKLTHIDLLKWEKFTLFSEEKTPPKFVDDFLIYFF